MDITKRLYSAVFLLTILICGVAVYESFMPQVQEDIRLNKILNKARKKAKNIELTDVLQPVETPKMEGQNFLPPIEKKIHQKPVYKSFLKEETLQIPPVPNGFYSALTNNYVIFREQMEITPELKTYIDNIHGNFVLDIIPFSLSSEFKRLFLMLFRTKASFMKYTARPEWSQAAADVKSRSIYLMEGFSFKPVLVHELTHLYFDGFFEPSEPPLWLSEGYAVYQQSKVQTKEENGWLYKNLLILSRKNYINFIEFNNAENLENYAPKEVELWYAQAYSVVKYLVEKDKDNFYQFSKNLKENMPIGKALYRSYGMPFNSLKALEYAWQAQIQKDAKRGIL